MTAPILLTQGDPTPQRLWTLDVNINYLTGGAANWVTAQYVEQIDFNPDDAQMNDSTITGDGGYSGQDAMGAAWMATPTFNRMTIPGSNPPAYDVVQEYLRNRFIGRFGAKRRVQCRIYDFDVNDIPGLVTPRVEAYMGFATGSWPGTGGGAQADERKVAVPLLGKGKLNIIAHPYPVTPTVPAILSVTPLALAAAGGDAVQILGSGFTSTVPTTGVKFAGTNATKWTVISDNEIVAVAPAHAAGTGPVVVTNTVGASTTGPNVTYA